MRTLLSARRLRVLRRVVTPQSSSSSSSEAFAFSESSNPLKSSMAASFSFSSSSSSSSSDIIMSGSLSTSSGSSTSSSFSNTGSSPKTNSFRLYRFDIINCTIDECLHPSLRFHTPSNSRSDGFGGIAQKYFSRFSPFLNASTKGAEYGSPI